MPPLRLNEVAVVGGDKSFGPIAAAELRSERRRLRVIAAQREPLEQQETGVDAAGAIELVERVSAFLVDQNRSDIGLRQDFALHAGDGVVGPRIETAGARSRIEEADVVVAEGPG